MHYINIHNIKRNRCQSISVMSTPDLLHWSPVFGAMTWTKREGLQGMQRRGVYVMRVAARLSGMHPQTLRKYERVGLLTPSRSRMLRMYSDEDIALLRVIKYLVDEVGLNLAGVEFALLVRSRLLQMEQELAQLNVDNQHKQRLFQIIDETVQMLDPS